VPGTNPELNTPSLDGCPFASPDGLSLYIASDRPGGLGGIDIWVTRRERRDDPWGAPQNLGAPINSAADDFCPSPTRGPLFLFVSTRPGGCGGSDIYVTRSVRGMWSEPENLGCAVNSAAGEAGPVLRHHRLYFSSTRPGGFAPDPGTPGDADIYVASRTGRARFANPVLAPGLNSAANDARPHLRWDGREIVFDSDRPGGFGGPDVWSSTRTSTHAPWSAPANLGPSVNSAGAETRPSFADRGLTLYFGSTLGAPRTPCFTCERSQVRNPPRPSSEVPGLPGISSFSGS
jgi:WD40-like Beta Propeller Repeat